MKEKKEKTQKTKKAVAIKYEIEKDEAPRVIAKGQNLIAEKMEEIANKYNIHIERNPELADQLYRLSVNQEIPEELYEAVAKILVYVYNL